MLLPLVPLLAAALPPAVAQEPHDVPETSSHAPGAHAQEGRSPNHLVNETSPYLLQHAYNPVDWYPWGETALERARAEDKPIFLSIGYSACHWCHVMERESFEDEEIAAFLAEHFISIKVDREERPDLDDLYMTAVQAMSGSGGWPMTVFLTPDRKPFWGGTYFPPRAAHGRPGFLDIVKAIHEAWENRREDLEKGAQQMSDYLEVDLPPAPDTGLPSLEALRASERRWVQPYEAAYDPTWGGFGPAPKFPPGDGLRWLLAAAERSETPVARDMALFTLQKMVSGGMYDQIGGGFARYSVDEKWMIPHFEKMLYDQGTLLPAYLEAWRQTGDPQYSDVVRQTCDYLLREMRDPGGAFWSSTDADSEGEEGKFFVWNPAQLEEVLGAERAKFAATYYGVTSEGNFEHATTALHRAATAREAAEASGHDVEGAEALAEEIRAALYAARAERIPPGTDDKILVGWNGLVIDALARAGRMLGEPRYTQAAAEAADFLFAELRQEDGHWWRAWRKGQANNDAVLEDHAYLLRGLVSVFQSTGEARWLARAEALAERTIASFWNEEAAIFWDTDGSDPTVLHRRATPHDGAIPSPNAVMLEGLLLLHAITLEDRWLTTAEKGYASQVGNIERGVRWYAATMRPLEWAIEEPRVAVVIGNGNAGDLAAWREALFAPGVPFLLTVFRESEDLESPLGVFAHRGAAEGKPTLYLCEGATCLPPSNDPSELAEMLAQ